MSADGVNWEISISQIPPTKETSASRPTPERRRHNGQAGAFPAIPALNELKAAERSSDKLLSGFWTVDNVLKPLYASIIVFAEGEKI
jgi:hypothetical protein